MKTYDDNYNKVNFKQHYLTGILHATLNCATKHQTDMVRFTAAVNGRHA